MKIKEVLEVIDAELYGEHMERHAVGMWCRFMRTCWLT